MTVRSRIDVGFPYTHSTGPVVGPALAALLDRQVLGVRCRTCAITLVPAREWCDRCGSTASELVRVGPGGTVSLAARARRPTPLAPVAGEFAWVLVRLDGADTDLLHVAPAGIEAGVRVHPVWRAERRGAITDIEWFAPGEPPEQMGVAHGVPESTIEIFEWNVSLPFTLSAGTHLSRFYDDVGAGRGLHGTRCTRCATVLVPPREVCPRCWADTEGWIEVADHGTVQTFAIVNVPFHGQEMPLPYVLAHILLDGAGTPILHVLGDIDPAAARTGMRVEAVWRDQRTGFPNDDIAWFRPER